MRVWPLIAAGLLIGSSCGSSPSDSAASESESEETIGASTTAPATSESTTLATESSVTLAATTTPIETTEPVAVPTTSIEVPATSAEVEWTEITRPMFWQAARTTGDGRGLMIIVAGERDYDDADPCTARYRGSAVESDEMVRITLFEAFPPGSPIHPCDDFAHYRTITIPLQDPLADRQVEAIGESRPVFDVALADVTWLPDGYTAGEEYAGPSSGSWIRTWYPTSPPPTGNSCTPGLQALSLTEGPSDIASQDIPGLTVVGTISVNDAVGEHHTSSNGVEQGEAVSWVRGGRGLVLRSWPHCSGDASLGRDILVQVAAGVLVGE